MPTKKARAAARPKPRPRTHQARRKPAVPPAGSTALMRLPTVQALTPVVETTALAEHSTVGALGLVELRLSDHAETVLARSIDVARISVKPTGEAYYSHPEYTKWFNEAFGRTGWSLRPASVPRQIGRSVVVSYLLYVHGQPIAFAEGEQEYFENNKSQSYGDAVEATVASGLRRCAKRLGVGLELWDKRFLQRFLDEHCVSVKVEVGRGDNKREEYWWRRKDDPPFWQEKRAQRQDAGQRQSGRGGGDPRMSRERTESPAGRFSGDEQPITDSQRIRFWTIVKKTGRDKDEVAKWLKARYNLNSSHDITRKDYEAICEAVEKPGELPAPVQRTQEARRGDDIELSDGDIQWRR